MDSPRQWNTIPASERDCQPPESLSHNTPLPCQSQTKPSLEIWDRWRDGERMDAEKRNVKEQWIGADGKKKGRNGGKLASLCLLDDYGKSLISEHHHPYLNTQHDTDIHTSYHNNQQHNAMQNTQTYPVVPYPPFTAYPLFNATSVYVHPSFSFCLCLSRLEMLPKQTTLAHSGHKGNKPSLNNVLFVILSA